MIHFESWQCSICGYQSCDREAVERCEARGVESTPYPIGLVFNSPTPPNFYGNMTFAIGEAKINGHVFGYSLWACRDNGSGDNTDSFCVGRSRERGADDVPDPNHPTFKRLVALLTVKGIALTCWNGSRAVPLLEFVAGAV